MALLRPVLAASVYALIATSFFLSAALSEARLPNQNSLAQANEQSTMETEWTSTESRLARCRYFGMTLTTEGIYQTYDFERIFGPETPPQRPQDFAATQAGLPADGTGLFFTTRPPSRWLAPSRCFDAAGSEQPPPVSQAELDSLQLAAALQDVTLRRDPDCASAKCFGYRVAALETPELLAMKERMKRYTLGPWGCPLGASSLSYLWVTHHTPDGDIAIGETIVATAYAQDLIRALRSVFKSGYAIARMRPQDFFQGDDTISMNANNTSTFRCPRSDQGGEHPLGQAIDINPLTNPFIKPNEKKRNPDTGFEDPPPATLEQASRWYVIEPLNDWSLAFLVHRRRESKGTDARARQILTHDSPVVEAFAQIGWAWGGMWNCCADYQHFSKNNTMHSHNTKRRN